MSFILRDARPEDTQTVYRLILALARYEKLEHAVTATEADIRESLFGATPRAYAILAEVAGRPVGFALWFYNYSTFLGRHGLYVEDVYVEPEQRGHGIGRAIFADLARRAVEQGCGRMEWWVLDWNAPSVAFYRTIGAAAMDEWTVQRLEGEALRTLAQTALQK